MTAMSNVNLIILKAFSSEIEAELAKGALEAEGVDSIISSDTAGGMRPHLAWAGSGFKLMVREDEVTIARTILEDAP